MSRSAATGMLVVALSLSSNTPVAAEDVRPNTTAVRSAWAFFEPLLRIAPSELLGLLKAHRVPTPGPRFEQVVLASLPSSGTITPTRRLQRKLDALDPVLRLHDREHDLHIRVFSARHGFVGLHARVVALISIEALEWLSPDELRAVVAHELGHDYFADEYHEALAARDFTRIRELELRCDGIALLTLATLDIDTGALARAVLILTGHNESIGATATAPRFVPLPERVAFIHAMIRRLRGGPHAATAAP